MLIKNIYIGCVAALLSLSGSAWADADIAVMGTSGNEIQNGDTTPSSLFLEGTDFGNVAVHAATYIRNFTIENKGSSFLHLTGTPMVRVTGSAAFSITQPSLQEVKPGGGLPFSVLFNPESGGIHAATIAIPSTDPNENPFTFQVTGQGTDPNTNHWIQVRTQTGYLEKDWQLTVHSSQGNYFPTVDVNDSYSELTFTIENIQDTDVVLDENPLVEFLWHQASDFFVIQPPEVHLAPGQSTTMRIGFNPSDVSHRSTFLGIHYNNPADRDFYFAIWGEGTGAVSTQAVLEAVLGITPPIGEVPLHAVLTGTGSYTDPGHSIVSYEWDVDGDGTFDQTSSTPEATWTYNQTGTVHAVLQVTDDRGLQAQDTAVVTVEDPAAGHRVWIIQPRSDDTFGNKKNTLHANTAPGSATEWVQFQYRPAEALDWIDIGNPLIPPAASFKLDWDVSDLVDGGLYEIRAAAGDTSNNTVYSPIVTVEIKQKIKIKQTGETRDSVVTWNSVEGRTYHIMRSEQCVGPWTQVEEITGTGQTMAFTNDNAETAGFFKIEESD